MKFGLAALLALASTDPDYTQDYLEEHCVVGDPLFYDAICTWFLPKRPVETTTAEELLPTTAAIQTIQPLQPDTTNGSVPIITPPILPELSTMQR
jgi:hypothetical protein